MSDEMDAFFDLFCYMAASARGLVDEPKMYGPLRLIESIERMIGILEDEGRTDEFYLKLKDKIHENKYVLMSDEDEFIELLDDVVVMLASKESES